VTRPPSAGLEGILRRLPLWSLGAFVLVASFLSVLGWSAVGIVDGRTDFTQLDGPGWLDAWFQGDSAWYHRIAEEGYSYVPGQQSPIAFFPAYPLLVHGVGRLLGGDFSTAGGVLTLVCAAGAVVLFADWVRSRVAPRAAVVAVALLLVYPYSFFLYGSGYSDALFLLTALGSFALLERRHYVLAGLVGALATAGRPIGVAVAVGLVVRALEMLAQDRAARRDTEVAVGSAAGPLPAPGRSVDARPTGRAAHVSFRELVQAIRFVRWRHASLLLSGCGLLGTRVRARTPGSKCRSSAPWSRASGGTRSCSCRRRSPVWPRCC
jgi:hypothetical protein